MIEVKLMAIKLNNIFYKFLLAFLIIILLLLTSYIFFYKSSYNLIKDSIIDIRLHEISRFAHDMDKNMYDIYKSIYYSKSNSNFSKTEAKEINIYYYFKEIEDFITKSIAANPFIEEMLFYHEESDTIITSEGSYKFDIFFDHYLINDYRNKYFWRNYFDTSYKAKIFPAYTYYMESFNDETHSKELIAIAAEKSALPNVRLIVLCKAEKITEWYGSDFVIVNVESESVIYNNYSGKIDIQHLLEKLSESEDLTTGVFRIQDEDVYVFYNKSSNYPWYYFKIIPYDSVFSKLNNFNLVSSIIFSIILLLCIFLSYYFSNRFYRPIKRVVDFIAVDSKEQQKTQQNPNEIQKIYNYIQHMCENYDYVERKYIAMQKVYKEYFYEKIINNITIVNNEEMLEELNVNLSDFSNFLTIYYTINFKPKFEKLSQTDMSQYDKVNILIKELVDITLQRMHYNIYSFEVKRDCYIAIVMLNEESFIHKNFEEKIMKILSNDLEYIYLTFSCSKLYHNIKDLKTAFDEALYLYNYRSLKTELQFLTNDSLKLVREYIVPRNILEKIDMLVELEKYDEFEIILFELLEDFQSRDVPILYIRKNITSMFNRVVGNVAKEVKLDSIDDIYKKIDACSNLNDFNIVLKSVCTFITNNLKNEQGLDVNRSIINNMMEYIRHHYSEDLYLNFFADKYKMSSIYLSKLFKDYSGENFSNYLKKIRLEKAKELLVQSDYKIKDLSLKVGYNDPNTFIKAYKRYFKVTPGEHRKLILIQSRNKNEFGG